MFNSKEAKLTKEPKIIVDAYKVIEDAYVRNEWYSKEDIQYAKKELEREESRIMPNVWIFKRTKREVESNEQWLVNNTKAIEEWNKRHKNESLKKVGMKALIFALVLFTPLSSAAETKPSCITNEKNANSIVEPVSKKDNSAQIIIPFPLSDVQKEITDKFTPNEDDGKGK